MARAKKEEGVEMNDDFESKGRRERDMVLAPNEFAFISDETKGEVNVFVGPNKQSLAGTDRCVYFDVKTQRFKPTDLANGIQAFMTAPEGWYVVLENPAEGDKHPNGNGKLSTPPLRVGKKVNISGPATFALWPGQMAKDVQGHSLRSNEYLLVRVYDEAAAKENWSKAVIKAQDGDDSLPRSSGYVSSDIPSEASLSMGKHFIIRGTEVSFYIPPTGIEVVPEHVNGEERYIREAVSLERLEYCLLLDQNGNKRYVRGPDVVFPRPTEKFVEAPIKSNPDKVKAKKFRAQELTPKSGIHIRVIADYVDESGVKHKAGDELFITGVEQPVYFPREEHAIIKYGEQDVHYGIAIPPGEARYVLDRETGVISIERGPKIFLADPRRQVIVQRALSADMCQLLYPGNAEALTINAVRMGAEEQDVMGAGGANAAFLNSSYVRSRTEDENYAAVAAAVTPDTQRRVLIKAASKSLPGDAFDRKSKYTAPRTLILNTKYDGAVQTTIWTGYAMLLIRKSGERRVVQGPGTFMLEYDEEPQVLSLSTGKPKTTDELYRTVFLQTTANKVSDIIEVVTRDFCRLNVKVSYRVNFEGAPERWFNVDNYVKFMCDHMRSVVRNEVQRIGIEEFYGNHTDIMRSIILGEKGEDGTRPGTTFQENGMRIYDVEILHVQMQNSDVEQMLTDAQRDVIRGTLTLANEQRKLKVNAELEAIKRATIEQQAATRWRAMEVQAAEVKQKSDLDATTLKAAADLEDEKDKRILDRESEKEARKLELERERAAVNAELIRIKLEAQKLGDAQVVEQKRALQVLDLERAQNEVDGLVKKAAAVSPDLIAALQSFSDGSLIEKTAESMAPLSILGGTSVVDVLKKLLEGTKLANRLS